MAIQIHGMVGKLTLSNLLGGGDEIDNLQPLQWKTNRLKNDNWPVNAKDYCQEK